MAKMPKAAAFTRGGIPTHAHPEGGGAMGPRRRRTRGTGERSYSPAEIVALGGAGLLAAGAGGLIVGGMRKGIGKN